MLYIGLSTILSTRMKNVIRYFTISACPDKNKAQEKVDDYSRWLPNEISQFSIPFQIDMSMVSSSVLNEKKNPKIEPPKQ